MGKLAERIDARHKKIREEAAERIYQVTHKAVLHDREYQKNKPQALKDIEDTLDEHVFDKLFT